MNIDLKRLATLTRYGLAEAGEYDVTKQTGPEEFDSLDVEPTPKDSNYQINNQGDNPMRDYSKLSEEKMTSDQVKQLEEFLGSARTDVLMGDYLLNQRGVIVGDGILGKNEVTAFVNQTLGSNMSVAQALDEFMKMLRSYERSFSEEEHADAMVVEYQESPGRFSYFVDSLGNVTVSDKEAGTSVYLEGDEALEFLGEINGKTDDEIQAFLPHYQHVMEDQITRDSFGTKNPMVQTVINSLQQDVARMHDKLVTASATAKASGDVNGLFSTKLILEELTKFEEILNDYISKTS